MFRWSENALLLADQLRYFVNNAYCWILHRKAKCGPCSRILSPLFCNITLTTPIESKDPFILLNFSLICISYRSHVCCMSRPSHRPWFDKHDNFLRKALIVKLFNVVHMLSSLLCYLTTLDLSLYLQSDVKCQVHKPWKASTRDI
jgi:hypothetical protein